jgi:hypothetical protein
VLGQGVRGRARLLARRLGLRDEPPLALGGLGQRALMRFSLGQRVARLLRALVAERRELRRDRGQAGLEAVALPATRRRPSRWRSSSGRPISSSAPPASQSSPSGLARKARPRPAAGTVATTRVLSAVRGTVKGSGSLRASPLVSTLPAASIATIR